MKHYIWVIVMCCWGTAAAQYVSRRPAVEERLFRSAVIDQKIEEVKQLLSGNPKLAWMFENCFPNTLETTVHYRQLDGDDDTFVYTGDIHAMWLRDSGAQVWPYVAFANQDPLLAKMLRGVILRQWKCIILDPYANAFNDGPTGGEWQKDRTDMKPELHERKYEIDSECYPIRLAYQYWKVTGDATVFGYLWLQAIRKVVQTFREQQRKDGLGPYRFLRVTDRAFDTVGWDGKGAPAKPCGLIASAFRPSDDAQILPYLVPANFMAVSSLRKASEILLKVNREEKLAKECSSLADEVEHALKVHAVVEHPKYGKIYAFEVDGYGNHLMMDDANVPSLLGMGYLGDVPMDDPVYQNTRRFVWSEDNPWFFRGKAGEGVGGPHIGYDMVWPMSIMMKCFTAQSDDEIVHCMQLLQNTDAETGFMHESFHKDDASKFTRKWFAWQNTLFGELVLKLTGDGKVDLLNQKQIEIVVHRGANALAPENTWESAKAALDYGAKWIEVDVRKSKDDVLFNLHDETLDRTTNGKGLLSDMLSENVRKLDAGSWMGPQFVGLHVPTIAEMLDSLQDKAYVFFDVKRGTPIPALVSLVREKGFADKSFFWFGDEGMLREFISLAPEMKIKVNASDIQRLKYWQGICTPSYVEIAPEKITDEFRAYCHQHGIKVMAACQEDDTSQFQLVIDKQADLVNLDRPEVFLPLLQQADTR